MDQSQGVVDWPHQIAAHDAYETRGAAGKALCICSPTGGGKGRMIERVICEADERRERTSLYTNRRILREQQAQRFDSAGIRYGVRASGVEPALLEPNQISSIQTENARVYKKPRWELHDARVVVVDEAHLNSNGVAETITRHHLDQEAVVVGYTATPMEMSHLYDELVVAGTKPELRECKALLPAMVYGCGELDTDKIKRTATGEFSIAEIRKTVWSQAIFGRVLDEHRRINPDRLPTLCCAPGVEESIWLAEQFTEAGHRAAHIDGDNVWIDGDFHKSNPEMREYVIDGSYNGSIEVLCNRFVLREGIDMPWLYSLILATPIGSFVSYQQTVGRVLRYWSDYDHVIVQDHGGNWWRHGSPNADVPWMDYWELRTKTVTDMRLDRIREKKEAQPIECPKCGAIRLTGPACVTCGFKYEKRSRRVIQRDGSLRELVPGELKQRARQYRNNDEKVWTRIYHRALRKGMTFSQAEGLFCLENKWRWPVRTLPLMPRQEMDWHRKVSDVPKDQLT